jgi:hypothetical protein
MSAINALGFDPSEEERWYETTVLGIKTQLPSDVADDESWSRVDLGPFLSGAIERLIPTVLQREGGAALLYAGRVNAVHADSGIGKSMVLALAAAQEMNAGRHVGWVDLEDPDPSTLIDRLRTFGMSDTTIAEGLHYFAPCESFTQTAVALLISEFANCTLVVIDSVGEAFGLEGIDENKDAEVGPWLRRVARPIADAGPAVVLVDHATKAADNPLHPSGSKRKRAAITGASYLLEVVRPLTRDQGGRVRLVCAKDRHGTYRRGDVAATIDIAVYPDGGVSAKVWPPLAVDDSADARRRTIATAAVNAAKNAARPLTQRELETLMSVRAAHDLKRAGIETAVALGALRTEEGKRRSVLHVYVRDLPTDSGATSQ